MIYEYLIKNYKEGEPIFFNELPYTSKNYLRQDVKKLVDSGKLNRVYKGVYYLPYTTVLGTEGKMSIIKYIEKKYLKFDDIVFGYTTGLQLVNRYGFSTQNSAIYEVCSNKATTKLRTQTINRFRIKVYKPKTIITKDNVSALQFLDLLSFLDRFSEISGRELIFKIKRYIQINKLDISLLADYLPLYPNRVYRFLYEGRLFE